MYCISKNLNKLPKTLYFKPFLVRPRTFQHSSYIYISLKPNDKKGIYWYNKYSSTLNFSGFLQMLLNIKLKFKLNHFYSNYKLVSNAEQDYIIFSYYLTQGFNLWPLGNSVDLINAFIYMVICSADTWWKPRDTAAEMLWQQHYKMRILVQANQSIIMIIHHLKISDKNYFWF